MIPVLVVLATEAAPYIAAGVAGWLLVRKVKKGKEAGDESSVSFEDLNTPSENLWLILPGDQRGENVRRAAEIALGAPYLWGGPNFNKYLLPGDLEGGAEDGMDCSGFVSTALRYLGMVTDKFCYHRTTGDMASACDAVAEEDAEPGDIAYYGGHVALVVGRDKSGELYVLSMSNGDHTCTSIAISEARGAMGKLLPANYRKVVCFMRPKKEFQA